MIGIRCGLVALFALCVVVFAATPSEDSATQETSVNTVVYKSEIPAEDIFRDLDQEFSDNDNAEEEDDDDELSENEIKALVAKSSLNFRNCSLFETYLTCGPTCHITCDTLGTSCPAGACTSGCFCKGSRVLSSSGLCISQRNCPSAVCPRNEVYLTSTNALACEPMCIGCTTAKQGAAGCYCRWGYVRSSTGACIKHTTCSMDFVGQTCGANEEFAACGFDCREKCGNSPTCTTEKNCLKHCFCKPGYVRISGVCVLATSSCPAPLNCPAGEIENACVAQPCAEKCNPTGCTNPPACVRQCVCPPNFKRNSVGVCIPEATCPLNCPLGEIENACVAQPCAERCNPTGCLNPPACIRMCVCPPNFKRNAAGVCIPEATCPLNCPLGEIENACVAQPCAEKCNPTGCTNPPACVRQCVCPPNFKRNSVGVCIPEATCPLNCPLGETESACVFPCSELCDARTCTNPPNCIRKCVCPVGQRRNAGGQCVTTCTCTGANTIHNCGKAACQSCQTTSVECSNIPATSCVLGCYCRDNYREVNGVCVPFANCNCGANSVYDNNGRRCQESCTGNACGQSTEPRGPGCYCRPGFGRSRITGLCISRAACNNE